MPSAFLLAHVLIPPSSRRVSTGFQFGHFVPCPWRLACQCHAQLGAFDLLLPCYATTTTIHMLSQLRSTLDGIGQPLDRRALDRAGRARLCTRHGPGAVIHVASEA